MLFWDRRMRNLPCTHVSAGRASGQLNSVQAAPGGYVIYAGSGAGEVTSALSKFEFPVPLQLLSQNDAFKLVYYGWRRL